MVYFSRGTLPTNKGQKGNTGGPSSFELLGKRHATQPKKRTVRGRAPGTKLPGALSSAIHLRPEPTINPPTPSDRSPPSRCIESSRGAESLRSHRTAPWACARPPGPRDRIPRKLGRGARPAMPFSGYLCPPPPSFWGGL